MPNRNMILIYCIYLINNEIKSYNHNILVDYLILSISI